MPAAKPVADRRPRNGTKPDSVIQRVANAIGFEQTWKYAYARSDPKAWIEPKSKPDVRLDVQPKP